MFVLFSGASNMGQNSCSILTTPTPSPLSPSWICGKRSFSLRGEQSPLPQIRLSLSPLVELWIKREKSTTLLENFRIIKYKHSWSTIDKMGMKYHATQIVCEESIGQARKHVLYGNLILSESSSIQPCRNPLNEIPSREKRAVNFKKNTLSMSYGLVDSPTFKSFLHGSKKRLKK